MALEPKLHRSFWSDEDVQRLGALEKLAVVWVLTNKDMNNVGFLKVSKRQFEFDTQAPVEALQGALKGLARGFRFEETEGGLRVLAVNFIHYQFGDQSLTPNNNIMKSLCTLTAALSEGFRETLLTRYEGLARAFRVLSPLQAPYKGVGRDQSRAVPEQSRAELSEGGLGETPNTKLQAPEKLQAPNLKNGAETENFAAENSALAFHVEQKTPVKSGLRYDLAEEVLRWLNERAGTTFLGTPAMFHEIALRLHQVGNDLAGVKQMVARQVSMWAGDGKMQGYLRPATLFEEEKFANYFGQRELALPDGDAAARAVQLQRLIDESPANRESAYWSSQATAAQKEQLKNWRAELRGLREGGRKAA